LDKNNEVCNEHKHHTDLWIDSMWLQSDLRLIILIVPIIHTASTFYKCLIAVLYMHTCQCLYMAWCPIFSVYAIFSVYWY